ncbi:MAG: adenosine deaminase [Candidatus Eiseniibacteriota bacterium]
MIPAFIAGLPKAELHMHLEGSLEPETLLSLARRNKVALPYESAEALRQLSRCDNLQAFLDLYYLGLTVLQSFEDFREMTAAYLERAAADNVRHAEVFISPQAHERRGIPMALFVEAILAAFDEAKAKHGITGGVILGLQRQFPEEDAFRMLREAAPYRDRVLGLGMGGPEQGNPPSKFTRVYAEAREQGWRTSAHAGEEGGADYVREAVELLEVDRIDHGVRCETDENLVRLLAERGTPLTVCPLSNVMLRVFPNMESHNIKRLYDAGLNVTINSDDPPYFGGYVNDNYAGVQAALGFTDADLARMAENSFRASFAPEPLRRKYLAELDDYRREHDRPQRR